MKEYLVCIKIKTNMDEKQVEEMIDSALYLEVEAGRAEEAEVVKVEECI